MWLDLGVHCQVSTYWIKQLKITMNSSTTCCFNEESDMNKELHASTPKLAK